MLKKSIILAAGYSRRLYPLTKNIPKPLLEIEKNKPIINYIIEKLEQTEIREVYVITNNKFYNDFKNWKNSLKTSLNIEIINDQTNSEETKLGALGDLYFTIKNKNIKEPILVIGGDNLFNFELNDMISYFNKNKKTVTSVTEEKNIEKLKHLNSTKLDTNNKIIFFEEKPLNPSSTLYSNCIYIYTKEDIEDFKKYIEKGNNPDQPGRFIQYLYKIKEVYGFKNNGKHIDIGTFENLEKARKELEKNEWLSPPNKTNPKLL